MSIVTKIELTTDFDTAAVQLEVAMADPNWAAPTIPLDYTFWNASENIERFNCYNFAANLKTTRGDQGVFIGETGLLRRNASQKEYEKRDELVKQAEAGTFENCARFTIEQTEKDGFIYRGLELPHELGQNCIALFLEENSMTFMEAFVNRIYATHEMHYTALRRNDEGKSVWAGKWGEKEVRSYATPSAMFQASKEGGCTHFAGYFTRSHDFDTLEHH